MQTIIRNTTHVQEEYSVSTSQAVFFLPKKPKLITIFKGPIMKKYNLKCHNILDFWPQWHMSIENYKIKFRAKKKEYFPALCQKEALLSWRERQKSVCKDSIAYYPEHRYVTPITGSLSHSWTTSQPNTDGIFLCCRSAFQSWGEEGECTKLCYL